MSSPKPRAEHSPLPWTNHACEGNEFFQRIRAASDFEEVGLMAYGPSNKNAEFVCKAVNLHAKLVAALEALKNKYKDDWEQEEIIEVMTLLREAAK